MELSCRDLPRPTKGVRLRVSVTPWDCTSARSPYSRWGVRMPLFLLMIVLRCGCFCFRNWRVVSPFFDVMNKWPKNWLKYPRFWAPLWKSADRSLKKIRSHTGVGDSIARIVREIWRPRLNDLIVGEQFQCLGHAAGSLAQDSILETPWMTANSVN